MQGLGATASFTPVRAERAAKHRAGLRAHARLPAVGEFHLHVLERARFQLLVYLTEDKLVLNPHVEDIKVLHLTYRLIDK